MSESSLRNSKKKPAFSKTLLLTLKTMSKSFQIYSGGVFKKTDQELQVHNSYDNSLVGTTYLATDEDLERSIQAAKSVEKELAKLSSCAKYTILMDIASQITAQRDELASLLAAEAAKPLRYALGEIDRAAQTFIVAAEEAKRPPSEIMKLDWTPASIGREGYIKHYPIGLVAGIAPFNFPLNLAVHKIAPAIAAGCPIILKPASSTPLSTLALAKIIDNTDLPKGAVSILPMDRETGNQLVTDDRFSLLSFTGSPAVGWEMKKNAGKKKVILELGGNAGVIITPTADIDKAVEKSLIGAFSYSGQVCIHIQRIIIHQSKYDEFMEKFLSGIQLLKKGSPLDTETEISTMIDEKNALRMEEWTKEALEKGAELLTGGTREGSYFAPTVFVKTNRSMKIHGEEAFGPSVVIEVYEDFEEAIDMINDAKFGLQAGVFTHHTDEMFTAWDELEVGGVLINEIPTFRVDHMPYGGVKDSGLGREGVRYAMQDMLEPRIMVVDRRK